MHIFDFTPELVDRIFEQVAYSRELKRFMRLRLISRRFKYFVDNTIFRLRLLGIPRTPDGWASPSYRLDDWRAFVLEYLTYQAWVEKEPRSFRGRIRRVAVIISEQIGDKEEAAIKARLKSLCRLALIFHDNDFLESSPLYSTTSPPPPDCFDAELARDICVAAVYLGYRSHIEKLISQGYQFCDWGDVRDVSSDVFGRAYTAAILSGDVSMLDLLIFSNPNYWASETGIHPFLQHDALYWAALLGYKDVFDFALHSGFIDVGEGIVDNDRDWAYYGLMEALFVTRVPAIYDQGASMFISKSRIFDGCGSPLARLTTKAREGNVGMVRYFLNQLILTNGEAGVPGLKSDYGEFRPLLEAVEGGNTDIIRLLLDYGADPNIFPVVDTVLMRAVRFSRLSMVKMLLEAGAKVNEGYPPPIVFAVFREDVGMFRLLRQYGAKLDTPESGNWAMAVAQFYQLESMVDVLVQEGVERGAILRRCAGREEMYQQQLFPLFERGFLSRAVEYLDDNLEI